MVFCNREFFTGEPFSNEEAGMVLSRREFVGSMAAMVAEFKLGEKSMSSLKQVMGKGGKGHPNILFFFTDDQRYDTIGAWGNKEIHTPNLN